MVAALPLLIAPVMASLPAVTITPALVWTVLTALPPIETAIRTIFHSGELVHNRCHYYYIKLSSAPNPLLLQYPAYLNSVGTSFLADLRKTRDESTLPNSCLAKDNAPDDQIITLKFEGSLDTCDLDQETFKLYSKTYMELSDDCIHCPGKTPEWIVPASFGRPSFDLLRSYLAKKSNLDEITINALSDSSRRELMALASYLHIPDLEARLQIAEIASIRSNPALFKTWKPTSHNLLEPEVRKVINLDRYSKEYKKLFTEIDNYKLADYNQNVTPQLDQLDLDKWGIIANIAKNVFFTAFMSVAPLAPHLLPSCCPTIIANIGSPTLARIPPLSEAFKFFVLYELTILGPAMNIVEDYAPITNCVMKVVVFDVLLFPVKAVAAAVSFTARLIICTVDAVIDGVERVIVFTAKVIIKHPLLSASGIVVALLVL